jgi:hypothetical protein
VCQLVCHSSADCNIADRLRTVLGQGGAAVRAVACLGVTLSSDEYLPTFRRSVMLPYSGSNSPGQVLGLLVPEDGVGICFNVHGVISQRT